MNILHIVPGLDEPWNGIAVAARMIAAGQNAAVVESRSVTDGQIASADEVWVHSMWMPCVWRACWKTLRYHKRFVRMVHANLDPVRLAYHGWKKRPVGPVERFFLRRADAVVATCPAEVGWIRAYEPRVKRVDVIDMKKFFKLHGMSTSVKAAADKRGMEENLHLLYLGRRHPLKGVEYLEEAVAKVNAVCSPRSAVTLRAVSNAFGTEKEKVWDWCDVLVLPTLSENFGLVVAEALERGKRAIVTDGAPAWSPSASATEDKGNGNDYGGRLRYLSGYRNGSAERKVELLVEAIVDIQTELFPKKGQE